MKKIEDILVNLGGNSQMKTNKFSINQPNLNLKLMDKILRGEPKSTLG